VYILEGENLTKKCPSNEMFLEYEKSRAYVKNSGLVLGLLQY